MWKDYVSGYLKNNRPSSLSIRISAFISALLLSLLCGLFYNLWKYEAERIVLEEGGWQSRIIGELDGEAVAAIKNFANVKDAVVNEKESKGAKTAVDIYFDDMRAALADTPRIAKRAGVLPEQVVYNYELLAMYFIRSPMDTAPRLLLPMFAMIVVLASFSLVVIIHNSFAVSMNARVHQFGIFSSIGASPRQIRSCLLQEAAFLCIVPAAAGELLGIAGSMGLVQLTNTLLGNGMEGRHKAAFGYHPLVLALALFATFLTVWISAWLPARKLSRLAPLEAVKGTGDLQLKRKKESRLLRRLFGVEGELAANALKAQRKALRTASFSLVTSFLAFTVMQCFFSLSGISTRETYFEKYQNVWDIMATVKDGQVDDFSDTGAIQKLAGVKSAVVYQKAMAKRLVTEEEISAEMKSFGGFAQAPEKYVARADGGWLVNAPVMILDDSSFLAYCREIDITPQLDGAVVINEIRDVTNPDFRHPVFMPYLTGESAASILRRPGNEKMEAEVPVLAYVDMGSVPALREEYATLDYYEVVHVVPVSLWKKVKGKIGGTEDDFYIRVLGLNRKDLEGLEALEDHIAGIIGQKYTVTCENRIQEYETNNKQIQGMKAVFGGLCALLAVIGIGNVFSNTLGFVRQRKREFARYLSVGMAPEGLRKMFCIEALALAGRPVLMGLPLAVAVVWYMLKMSYVGVGEFLDEAPLVPVVVFVAVIFGAVALAYYLAWRSVRGISLAEVLRDDTMM